MRNIDHFIGGGAFASGERQGDVFDPNRGNVQAKVRLGTAADLEKAVGAAREAFPAWAATNPQRRARVMFNFKALVERNMDDLALLLASEHGKVIADAKGDVQRGLEVIEFACGIPHALKGEYTQGAGPGIDVYSMRQPLGIVAGITPFNFPAMIPLWMFPIALAAGNTFVLKPSPQTPLSSERLRALLAACGFPEDVLQIVHGESDCVERLIAHPETKAVSFVGSSAVARRIQRLAVDHHKRVQAL
ncbi:MAG: aldehyde dehydrogenase family protein, partial [Alphaproteobacteria bacterium]|nr:aldehyde dehydrogenase family protein [Alphaproteobacteria bacterium]